MLDVPQIFDPSHVFTATQRAVVGQALDRENTEKSQNIRIILEKKTTTFPYDPQVMYTVPDYILYEDPSSHHIEIAINAYDLNDNKLRELNSLDSQIATKTEEHLSENTLSKEMEYLFNKDGKKDVESDILQAINHFDEYKKIAVNKSIEKLTWRSNLENFQSFFNPFSPIGLILELLIGIAVVLFGLPFLYIIITKYLYEYRTQSKNRAFLMSDNDIRKFLKELLIKTEDILGCEPYCYIIIPTEENVVKIRKILIENNKKQAWAEISDEIYNKAENIRLRVKLYNEHQENSEENDRKEAKQKITQDIKKLAKDIDKFRISLMPKMNMSIKAKIMGEEIVDSPINMLVNERLNAIEKNIKIAEENLPYTMKSEAYTLSEMRKRYLPDTINTYIQAKKHDPITAENLFNNQLQILESGVDDVLIAIREGSLDKLRINGEFLKKHFQNQQ